MNDVSLDGQAVASSDETPDASLLDAYARETEVPSPLQKWYNAFDQDRRYVNDTCMQKDAQDCVGTNHILRNQWLVSAMLNTKQADFRIEPDEAIWPDVPQIDPLSGMPTGIAMPGECPPEIEKFAHTCELLSKKLLKEARFRQQLRGAIQDTETNALVFIKVNQQEDLARDPIGAMRFNDQQDNFALYRYWKAKEAAGDIVADSPEAARLKELDQTVRGYLVASLHEQMEEAQQQFQAQAQQAMAADPFAMPPPEPFYPQAEQIEALQAGGPIPLESVPEVASWVGFPIDFILPDDIRFSWDITRPEDFYRARRVQHRVYYDEDDFAAKFNLSVEEMKLVPRAGATSNTSSTGAADPTPRDSELGEKSITKQIEVWECWDRQTNTVCSYVKGYRKKLQCYTPHVVWRNWFPFIPVLFNRVTGRFVGISSATLQRPLQDEINLYRSHERHAKKAAFPRILVKKGAFSKTEAQKYKRALPYEVIEVQDPDELKAAIHETTPVAYNPALYDNSKAEMDLQRMAGISLVSGGATNASSSATEVAEASQGLDIALDFKRGILEDVYADVITCLLDMAVTVLPEENVKALVGPGAFWPQQDRETFWRHSQIVIRPGSTGRPDVAKRMEFFSTMTQVARNMGMVASTTGGPALLDEIAREIGYHGRLSKFFQVAPMPMPGMPPASGGSPPSTPSPDSIQGEGGGRPPGGAPSPESIPNHPQVTPLG